MNTATNELITAAQRTAGMAQNILDAQWALMDSILDACRLDVERMKARSFTLRIEADAFPEIEMVFSPSEMRPFVNQPEQPETTKRYRLVAQEIRSP